MRTLTYSEALNEAIIQEMERDPAVFVYGIGVSDHTRMFGTTMNVPERARPVLKQEPSCSCLTWTGVFWYQCCFRELLETNVVDGGRCPPAWGFHRFRDPDRRRRRLVDRWKARYLPDI